MDTMLEAKGLAKSYGAGAAALRILDGIRFSVGKGEFVSIVGPSGCGKTTLLMALAGLLKPDAGTVSFKGNALSGPSTGIAVVFQDYSRSLFAWKSNLDNVMFGMFRNRALSRQEKRDRRRPGRLRRTLSVAAFRRHAATCGDRARPRLEKRTATAR